MTNQELATVLAALRFYQEAGMGAPDNLPSYIHDIATDSGEVISLDGRGIDELCEKLNLSLPKTFTVYQNNDAFVVRYKDVRANSGEEALKIAQLGDDDWKKSHVQEFDCQDYSVFDADGNEVLRK